MGLRFNRRIKISKGATLNLGKKGASISTGVKGAKVTFGRGTRTTVGIPGTGVSYTHYHNKKKDNQDHYEDIENNINENEEIERVQLIIPEGIKEIKVDKKIYWLAGTVFVLLLISFINVLVAIPTLIIGVVSLVCIFSNKSFKNNYYTHQAITKYKFGYLEECKNYCNKALALDPSNESAKILLETIKDI